MQSLLLLRGSVGGIGPMFAEGYQCRDGKLHSDDHANLKLPPPLFRLVAESGVLDADLSGVASWTRSVPR